LFLLGSDVTGDGSARFVVFVPSIFLHVWRDWGGVICLGGSNDVPDELTIGGVRLEKNLFRLLCDGVGKAPGRGFVTPWPAFQQIPPLTGILWARQGVGSNFLEG